MIDRYGNPIGTPPEIYKEQPEFRNTKNDIDHGNEYHNNYAPFEFNNEYIEEPKKKENKPKNENGQHFAYISQPIQQDPNDNYPYIDFEKENNYVDPKLYRVFENSYAFEMNSEQPLYVNLKQYDCIRKRKIRRDFLDTLMAEANQAGYLHESRHKHAMNRQRAPSGRFLTKEETEAMKRNENYNSEN
ncbi:Transcriptional activator [Gurleya vavrai]